MGVIEDKHQPASRFVDYHTRNKQLLDPVALLPDAGNTSTNAVLTSQEVFHLEQFRNGLQSLPPSVWAFFDVIPNLSYDLLGVNSGYLYHPATVPGEEVDRELFWNRGNQPEAVPDRTNLSRFIGNIRRSKRRSLDLTASVVDEDESGNRWVVLPLSIGLSLRGIVCLPWTANGLSIPFYSSLHTLLNESLERITLAEIAYQYSEHEKRHSEAQQNVTVREIERRQIAAELHDELGQSLTALQLQLSALITPDMSEEQVAQLGLQTKKQIGEMLKWVRSVTQSLNPRALSEHDLVTALDLMLAQLRAGATVQITSRLEVLRDRSLPEPLCLAIYRIIQEATTNAVRYANASHIIVSIDLLEDSQLRLEVRDDGCGFTSPQKSKGNGLANIRERALALRGTVTVLSTPGTGTAITAILPLSASEEQKRHKQALPVKPKKRLVRASKQQE